MEELQKDVITLKEKVRAIETCIDGVVSDVKEIKEKLLNRPSWSVMVIISLLSSVCVGLAVAYVTKFN